ncbi:MAG TPA: P-loop NTPase [Rectinemataceae bacterium]|nr:P-loop NTPase [Rectinemataceae bacterium]
MRIVPIASGKGGVGKSLVAANLSIALGQAGKRVVLADLDLGASNLHVILGLPPPKTGIGTFLAGIPGPGSSGAFESVIVDTDYQNLRFVPGDAELPGLANIRSSQKNLLVKRLLSIDADYLVLDLGAGTGSSILDFFLMSSQGLVVTTPALTATLNAYLFLKNAVFRLLYGAFGVKSKAYEYLESLRRDGASLQKAYVPAILERVAAIDPERHRIAVERLARFRPRLLLNMLEEPKDAEKAQKIRRSCQEYLTLKLEHLGVLYRDDLQDVALGSRIPIIRYKPQSILSQAIYRTADKLISTEDEPDAPLSLAELEGSFQTAELEAESDFGAKLSYVEDLLNSGALTTGDLVETVKSQQFEIDKLRRENQFLKFKLARAIGQGFAG